MAERTVELDEPVMDEQGQKLENAVERAERAEAELAKLKQQMERRPQERPGDPVAPRTEDNQQHAGHAGDGHAAGEPQTRGVAALREDSMMRHLLDSLDRGEHIGHYGRLVFAMIARHFMTDDEVIAELTKDKDFSEEQARQMLVQVEGRDYNPPRRERILEWQREQEFPILPNQHDPDCGNVYKTLRFPKEIYDHIGHYQEEKASS